MEYYNKEITDILRWGQIGTIVCHIAERLNIPPIQALKDFYKSHTCLNFHNKNTGLYLFSPRYVADSYLIEIGKEI